MSERVKEWVGGWLGERVSVVLWFNTPLKNTIKILNIGTCMSEQTV